MAAQGLGRVLLAEDAPSVGELLQLYLKKDGYAVEWAEDGKVALEKFAAGRFDLVIMDMQMPVLDGYAAIRGIREFEKRRGGQARVPIIALTGNVEKEDVRKCLEAGASAYLSKPVERQVFLDAVSAQVGKADAAPSARAGEILVEPDPEVAYLVPRFLVNRREDVQTIRRALERSDFAAIADLGHKMAGVGTSFGFEPVSRFGRAIELAAKARDGKGVAAPLEELARYLERVRLAGS